MIESLPNRPLKRSDLNAIEAVTDWQVRGAVWRGGAVSPYDVECTDVIVILAGEWFGAFRRERDGWITVTREECDVDEDSGRLFMVALDELGLTDEALGVG